MDTETEQKWWRTLLGEDNIVQIVRNTPERDRLSVIGWYLQFRTAARSIIPRISVPETNIVRFSEQDFHTEASLYPEKTPKQLIEVFGKRLQLQSRNLRYADFRGSVLIRADLQNAILDYADLHHAQLQGANLFAVKLHSANLIKASLQSADLSGAKLQRADLTGAKLQRASLDIADAQCARFMWTELQGAHLDGTKLRGANFYSANLEGASLFGAKLEGAVLAYAKLQGSNLSRASLQAAYLVGSELQGAYLAGADLRGVRSSKSVSDNNINNSIGKKAELSGVVRTQYLMHDAQKAIDVIKEAFYSDIRTFSSDINVHSMRTQHLNQSLGKQIDIPIDAIGRLSAAIGKTGPDLSGAELGILTEELIRMIPLCGGPNYVYDPTGRSASIEFE